LLPENFGLMGVHANDKIAASRTGRRRDAANVLSAQARRHRLTLIGGQRADRLR
jgi:hypothetical protein